MAPNFFTKLAKAAAANSNSSNHERLSSETTTKSSGSGSGFSIGRNRSQSTSINSENGSNGASFSNIVTQATTLNSRKSKQPSNGRRSSQGQSENQGPSIVTTPADGDGGHTLHPRGSVDTLGSQLSSQPNFTIVPPSPLVRNKELESDDEDDIDNPPFGGKDQQSSGTNSRTTTATTQATSTSFQDEYEDNFTPTPTPTAAKHSASPPSPSSPPPSSAVSKDKNMAATNGGLAPGPYQVRKQTSNKSMNKKLPPSELQINTVPAHHSRSATAPPETSPNHGKGVSSTMTEALVESPTELNMPLNPVTESPSAPNSPPRIPPNGLTIQRENTTASVLSLGGIGGSAGDAKPGKRPWKRSTTRKPTGLASAIAASGLAMANPSLTAAQVAQATATMSPPVSGSSSKSMSNLSFNGSAPGSPPYMSKSPAQSSTSQRSRHAKAKSADLSPRSMKSGSGNKSPRRRSRRPSTATSAKSDVISEYSTVGTATTMNGTSVNGDDTGRQDYYSGLELDETTDSSDNDSGSDLSGGEFGEGDDLDIPVTGFAVASHKRNADFHELFPTVPEGDYLIEDYGCAMQREILIQGRLYISENHICFHANIFGWITDLSLPIYEITALEKKMTAFVIPNAIQITTRQAKYTFTSFLSRDTTFDVIYNIWRLARPEDGVSLLSSGRGSMDGPGSSPALVAGAGTEAASAGAVAVASGAKLAPVKKATICACGREGRHYPEVAMEVVVPGTPEKINSLIFASGFMKDFMVEDQKLFDIQMSDWAPLAPGSKLLTRNMSYIKPLAGSLGPKQTKCEIKDETDHMDFDDYVSTVTTTRTPDVPSGGVFSVKTRTCVMWASPVSSKVVVTTQVEWTGRSFIKGIIERSAIDGQKVYHTDLEKAMRSYIQEHQTEFLPEGVEVAAVALTEEPEPTNGVAGMTADDEKHQPTADELKRRERERNARGLQWAWDTFDGAYQVAKRSTKGALELIRDAWDQSTSTTILWFVIVILVFSNCWTLLRMGTSKADAARKLEVRKVEEREKWVQSIVTALWDEMAHGKNEATSLVQSATSIIHEAATPIIDAIIPPTPTAQDVYTPNTSLEALKAEVKQLQNTLEAMEERVKAVREDLAGLKKLNDLD